MPDKTENRARAEGLRDMLVDLQVGHDTTVAEVLVRITAALDAAEARGLERAAEVCDSLDGWRAWRADPHAIAMTSAAYGAEVCALLIRALKETP